KPATPTDTDAASPAPKAPTTPTRRSTTVGLSDEERAARRSAAAKKAAETRRRRAAERAAAAAGDAPTAAAGDAPAAKPTRGRTTTQKVAPTRGTGEASEPATPVAAVAKKPAPRRSTKATTDADVPAEKKPTRRRTTRAK